jgi:response regulator RpfG family c-di-GMP phosphodiesterase
MTMLLEPGDATGLTVLVVDDDASVRRALRRVLERSGYQVRESPDAESALAQFPSGDIALVISDMHMPPGHDGTWLLREIRAVQPEVPVVMLTGNADIATAVACLKLGASDYLAKPVLAGEVQARSASAIAQRRMELEFRRLQGSYQSDLERQVLELSRRNEAMFLGQVQMAVRMLEAKDPYTGGHASRVADYSQAVAASLGLTDHDVSEIHLGGELHDIGKIGTRDAVLHKPGKLTTEEFDEIKRHTTDGERMLSVLRTEHPLVLEIVRSHHERMNGSGFPDGLVGEQIPLAARIVAVSDAYDAMTTTRSYRAEQPVSWAVAELRRCAGESFDSRVVEAFLDLHASHRWGAPPT